MTVGTGGVIHANVNCSDLATSLAFYRDELGLAPVVRTAPEGPQDGAAFGLDRAQWDAWIMAGPEGFAQPVVDLLQWIVPAPAPREGPTGFTGLVCGAPAGREGTLTDPDGTAIELRPGPPGLIGVRIGCTDRERSLRFYREVVDLGYFVELVDAPGPAPAEANTLGIWRLALATADLDADVAALARAGVTCRSAPVEMSMGPGLPAVRFVLFADPDGTTLELIERRP